MSRYLMMRDALKVTIKNEYRTYGSNYDTIFGKDVSRGTIGVGDGSPCGCGNCLCEACYEREDRHTLSQECAAPKCPSEDEGSDGIK